MPASTGASSPHHAAFCFVASVTRPRTRPQPPRFVSRATAPTAADHASIVDGAAFFFVAARFFPAAFFFLMRIGADAAPSAHQVAPQFSVHRLSDAPHQSVDDAADVHSQASPDLLL